MGGGLLQLVAYGAQDVYLSGNPQITFFKVAYRRHTNFSMESIEQTFNGNADFGRRVTCQISRNGDLIHRMYLQVNLPAASFSKETYVGLALVKSVELEIGGQRIDKQYGDWMYIWNELSLPTGKQAGFKSMVGYSPEHDVTSTDTTLYVPLEFWFCRNPGLALPLIALQYHEVKVNIEFAAAADAGITSTGALGTSALWVDYVFLDTDERRRFAQLSHEYLIEQLQFTGEENISGTSSKVKLNFNHPVKELVWVMQNSSDKFADFVDGPVGVGTTGTIGIGTTMYTGGNYTVAAKLQLNGHDRFAERQGKYFNMVQPFQHHTNVPTNKGINVYSFALKPEEHQPSGTLNFSRIDSAVLNVTTTVRASRIRVYAVNYNVLRVMSGMGGLAYSN